MLSTQTLVVFLGATLLVAMSPGPNTLLVISQALAAGMSRASLAIAGLALSSIAYLAATVTGLAALAAAWPVFFAAIQLAGVAYLLYLGVRMIVSAGSVPTAEPADAPRRSPVLQGFVTSSSNPKSILYWSAFLPQFVDRAQPVTQQLVLLGVLGTLLEVVVLLAYAFVAVQSRDRLVTRRFARTIDRLAGLYFVALAIYFGALLALRRA
jgi:homoserine/homoserine lactone efflux protein